PIGSPGALTAPSHRVGGRTHEPRSPRPAPPATHAPRSRPAPAPPPAPRAPAAGQPTRHTTPPPAQRPDRPTGSDADPHHADPRPSPRGRRGRSTSPQPTRSRSRVHLRPHVGLRDPRGDSDQRLILDPPTLLVVALPAVRPARRDPGLQFLQ